MLHHVSFVTRRRLCRGFHVKLSETVQAAIAQKLPIVALESTIITHGLPYPDNLRLAREVESVIVAEGCVPATTAFIDGKPLVGLDAEHLELMATAKNLVKVSRRDIPHVMASKLSGGTTIAGTMILAHRAGIKIFATGGLGGVHRGVANTWDISADLEELGQTPVAVVCAGPKSILDVPKTIEFLETKGVPVSTLGPPGTNVPGFFTRDSGVKSPFTFSTPKEAAEIVRNGTEFGLENGYVFCVPCPEHLAMDPVIINSAINMALVEADKAGITGKEATPFLLKKVWEATKGDTVTTNIEFVKNNARVAAQMARELALSEGSVSVMMPLKVPSVQKPPPQKLDSSRKRETPDVCVVGSLAQDLTCTLKTTNISPSSFPGQVTTTLGGVGHNVALASAYSGAKTRLISVVGEKEEPAVKKSLSPAIDAAGIQIISGRTARYIAMNDAEGELIVACADMESVEKMDPKHIEQELRFADAKVVVFDGNLGVEQTQSVLAAQGFKIFEPTSVPKSARIADHNLKVFPNPSINMATPNTMELMSMFEEFSFKDRFDLDHWFPIIDAIPMSDPVTQFKIDRFLNTNPHLESIVESGLLQAAVHILPYIPNLFVKLGKDGVLTFQLIEYLKDRTGDTADGRGLYILSKKKPFGLLMQYYPVPEVVPASSVQSVNGIGDTFCGVLAAQLSQTQMWLRDDGPSKANAITKAQRAAALSLQTFAPVSTEVSQL
ncbi:hypothetical protein B9G98_02863 [Wickerhamiella sorbophila]|uniref:Carbohydrate kinase PfkB domain-containing protein n=1 Tax=Wickerhamiella sorbophila TaxID=45607 RepID=A0A2T0FJS4_9ASCO|nr:hypothetical protein B9G98_02863 [Wickerhamiella sorbophila]PRT55243.1 hypothetical protein B9G98_02863 [Wickerhamiella sorbophila]